jgi:hypothetical protein
MCKKLEAQEDNTSKKHKLSSQAVPAIYTLTGVTLKSNLLKIQDTRLPKQSQYQGLLPRKLIIATDISVHPPEAAFAWVITNNKGRTITSQASKIEELEISLYHVKAYGILDVIKFLQTFRDQVEEWSLYCDNKSLINQLKSIQDIDEIPTEWTNSDIITTLKEKLIDGGYFHQVKGHQQLTTENNKRIAVRLNILVDSMANQAINSMSKTKGIPDNSYIQIGQKQIFKLKNIKNHCSQQRSGYQIWKRSSL